MRFIANISAFLLVAVIISTNNCQSQRLSLINSDEGCSFDVSQRRFKKMPWVGNNDYLYQFLDSVGYYNSIYDYNNVLYRVPVQFWIHRKRNRGGGAGEAEIKRMMNELNFFNVSNNTGFIYYMRPEIKYINCNRHVVVGFYLESFFQTLRFRDKNCVNVHVVDDIKKFRLFRRSSTARGSYNLATKGVIVKRNASTTTLAHEVGHFFGLLHPHRNCNKGKCRQEAVNRNRRLKGCFRKGLNCEKNGDGLCDTPAEPNLNSVVDHDCNYTGNETDNWGDAYQPNTHNIMSYPAALICRNEFTGGQIGVMLYTAKNKNVCAWDAFCFPQGKNYKHQYIFDAYEPDNSMQMATIIKFGQTQQHTFHQVFMDEKDIDCDVDWIKFRLKRNANVQIATASGKFIQTEIQIVLYDQWEKEIASAQTGDSKVYPMLQAQNLKKGWYYIKVTKPNTIKAPDIADYTIKIAKQ